MKTRLLKKLRAKYCKLYTISKVQNKYRVLHSIEKGISSLGTYDTFSKACRILAEYVRLDMKSEIDELRERNGKSINLWK